MRGGPAPSLLPPKLSPARKTGAPVVALTSWPSRVVRARTGREPPTAADSTSARWVDSASQEEDGAGPGAAADDSSGPGTGAAAAAAAATDAGSSPPPPSPAPTSSPPGGRSGRTGASVPPASPPADPGGCPAEASQATPLTDTAQAALSTPCPAGTSRTRETDVEAPGGRACQKRVAAKEEEAEAEAEEASPPSAAGSRSNRASARGRMRPRAPLSPAASRPRHQGTGRLPPPTLATWTSMARAVVVSLTAHAGVAVREAAQAKGGGAGSGGGAAAALFAATAAAASRWRRCGIVCACALEAAVRAEDDKEMYGPPLTRLSSRGREEEERERGGARVFFLQKKKKRDWVPFSGPPEFLSHSPRKTQRSASARAHQRRRPRISTTSVRSVRPPAPLWPSSPAT